MEAIQQPVKDFLIPYNNARDEFLKYINEDNKFSIVLIGDGCNGKTFLLKECSQFLKHYTVDESIGDFAKEAINKLKNTHNLITSCYFDPYKKYNLEVPDHVKIIDMSNIKATKL